MGKGWKNVYKILNVAIIGCWESGLGGNATHYVGMALVVKDKWGQHFVAANSFLRSLYTLPALILTATL